MKNLFDYFRVLVFTYAHIDEKSFDDGKITFYGPRDAISDKFIIYLSCGLI